MSGGVQEGSLHVDLVACVSGVVPLTADSEILDDGSS